MTQLYVRTFSLFRVRVDLSHVHGRSLDVRTNFGKERYRESTLPSLLDGFRKTNNKSLIRTVNKNPTIQLGNLILTALN